MMDVFAVRVSMWFYDIFGGFEGNVIDIFLGAQFLRGYYTEFQLGAENFIRIKINIEFEF
jgi:hypothetical protein